MIVHLINLDRDRARLERFRELNAHLPEIIRPPAIEGRRLDRLELEKLGYIAKPLSYNNSALGSAHSHIELWRKAVEKKSAITVAEDDAIFARHFVESYDGFLQRLPTDWDIVLWGWNFDAFLWVEIPEGVSPCKIQFSQDELRRNIEIFRARPAIHAPLRLRHSFGIMAYTVSPSGAKSLMDICLPLRDTLITFAGYEVVIENKTIDAMMNQAYPRLKAYVCMPPLAVSENRHETSNTRLDP
jgi:GR25 family glycosyltransferase involved in LPS biosynthesis